MGLLRDSLAVKKLKAIRRAQMSLKQKLERYDWEEAELLPEVEALLAGRPVLGLEAGTAFDIVVEAPRASRHSRKAKRRA